MKQGTCRVLAALLSFLIMIGSMNIGGAVAFAATTEDRLTVTYTFTGDEAAKAGFAQGDIVITPGSASATAGYYLVYYADDTDTLKNYDELASIKITGAKVTHSVKDGTMIPSEATRIAVFESATRFYDDTPSIESAAAVAVIPQEKRLVLDGPEMSFGAVSDTHTNYEAHNRGAYQKWETALDFFSAQNMDYVIVTGDMTGDEAEAPLTEQYQTHLDIIESSDFPADRVYEAIGNHGNTPDGRTIFAQYTGGADQVHPYEDSAYYSVLFEGKSADAKDNLFIFMAQELEAPGDSAAYDNFSKEQIDWLESLLVQYGDREDTNVFIIEHSPFLDFGAGDRVGGGYRALVTFKEEYTQTMRLKALLETYKDAIVMSGHTHLTLYDTENYSDEYNSFARTVHVGSACQPCGYGEGSTFTRSTDGRYTVTPTYGSEAYLVDVYAEYIVYTGYNLSTGKIIPGACLLIPVKAYGGPGKPEPKPIPTPEEAFRGSGTADDPYLITDAEDFKVLTDGFNASNSSTESDMYGYGLFFEQTADIDMRGVEGYAGTAANGNAKAFFAGHYNGGGYSITVDIEGDVQRSVFPYVYGVLYNVVIKGQITSEESAQPVRTLYGSLINCVFDMTLSANRANGVCYSGYGYMYNVYSKGTVSGTSPDAVAPNISSSATVRNLYHAYTLADGSEVTDTYGIRTDEPAVVAAAFNDRSSDDYTAASAKLESGTMLTVYAGVDGVAYEHPATLIGDANQNGVMNTADVKCIMAHLLTDEKLTGQALTLADYSGDKQVNSTDARQILIALVNM